MIVLGIHDGPNAAAALVTGGKLTGFRHESRLHDENEFAGFPQRAISSLLAEARISPKDVGAVAFAGHVMKTPRTGREYLKQFSGDSAFRDAAKTAISYIIPGTFRTEVRRKDRLAMLAKTGIETSKAVFVDAHLAASMLGYASGAGLNRRCLVVCAGIGNDRLAASVHVAQNGRLERIASVHEEDSLGDLLEHITYMLGMVPQRDEQLVMDLGANAQGPGVDAALKRFELLFEFDEQLPLNWHRASNMPETSRCQDFLRKHFRRRRFDHIAGGCYRFLSGFCTEWIGRCAHKTEIRDIVVCGDLFELGELMPVASRHRDVVTLTRSMLPGLAGNAIGAALLVVAEKEDGGAKSIAPVGAPYVGPEPADSDCSTAVAESATDPSIHVERPDNMAKRLADLLAMGAIIGRFAGKEDLRQRGLGNRSVLARADHAPARAKLREAVSPDAFWLSPAVLWQGERLRANFREADTLPEAVTGEYYLTPRNASPWYGFSEGRKIPVHAVSRASNPAFWDVLDAYHQQVGRTPLLGGTWRDERGKPVSTPTDAARLWRKQGLSGAVIGDWLVYDEALAGDAQPA